jgi:asparagine synthase (glutamine-hydrolysing)
MLYYSAECGKRLNRTQRIKSDNKLTETIRQPTAKPLRMEIAAKRLQELLLQSTRDRVSDVREVAIAFSGGLDSSVLAFLAKKCGVKTQLITVGLGNTTETAFAQNVAQALNLPIHVVTYSIGDVEETLPKVLCLIENSDPVNVGIAIPLFWTAQVAATQGLDVLLAGQGADELFGGYHRYLNIYAEKGEEALQEALFHDFATYYESDFQRDNSVCAYHKVKLRLPYTDSRVVDFALLLPVSLKIESPSDKLRKKVLRNTAEHMGVPAFIANRAKKAIQYATGVDKALRKLAKRENLNTSDYCRKVLQGTFQT